MGTERILVVVEWIITKVSKNPTTIQRAQAQLDTIVVRNWKYNWTSNLFVSM